LCNVEYIFEIKSLTSRHVGVHGDEMFIEGMLVFGMESAPKDGVAFAYCYPTGAKENLALIVELSLVIDDISLISYVLLGILGSEVNELLS